MASSLFVVTTLETGWSALRLRRCEPDVLYSEEKEEKAT